MRSEGASEIVDPVEIPRDFSQSVQDSPDAFGIDYVAEVCLMCGRFLITHFFLNFQVICLDDPSLDSYLCTVCDNWSDPKGMLRHLCSTDHKSTYMVIKRHGNGFAKKSKNMKKKKL